MKITLSKYSSHLLMRAHNATQYYVGNLYSGNIVLYPLLPGQS